MPQKFKSRVTFTIQRDSTVSKHYLLLVFQHQKKNCWSTMHFKILISEPNKETVNELCIIRHLSWTSTTTNCDIDVYVSNWMKHLLQHDFSTNGTFIWVTWVTHVTYCYGLMSVVVYRLGKCLPNFVMNIRRVWR